MSLYCFIEESIEMSESSRFFEDATSSLSAQVKLEKVDPIEYHRPFLEKQASTINILQESTPTPSSPTVLANQSLFIATDSEDDSGDEAAGEDNHGYALFESQIQTIIPDICPSDVSRLHAKFKDAENPVLNAVNDFYEGDVIAPAISISKQLDSSPLSAETAGLDALLRKRKQSQHQRSPQERIKRRSLPIEVHRKQLSPSIKWRRYIGGLQVVSWATRPTVKPIPYGTPLTVEKSTAATGAPRRGRHGITNSVSSYLKLVQDGNDPSRRKEIGRLPEDIASVLFPLVDQEICDFDITCVFCDGRLSTGDSFIVQLDCYLTSKIFDSLKRSEASYNDDLKEMRQSQSFNRTAYETESEQSQHRRQVALVRLFSKLDFKVRTDDDINEEVNEVIDLEDEVQMSQLDPSQPNQKDTEFSDEMNLNQLKEFYKRTQTEKVLATLPETETLDNFKLELRSYQKQGLTWMLRSEREIENTDSGDLMNPLWKEFKWPKDKSWSVMRDEKLRDEYEDKYFYGNLYSGEFSLEKPILKSVCRGGILADEMGLGKTISTLALIHNAPFDKEYDAAHALKEKYAFNTTLIIVPTSLLAQWQDEFKKANNDNSQLLVYYGSETNVSLTEELCQKSPPLVIFTTYGTVQNEWSRMKNLEEPGTGLFGVKFFRIVLDEGHNIRNRMAKTTKACYDLRSSRKWLLTGTPIINRLDDLYSLVKFLELEPWSNISYWNTFITSPFEKKNYKQALDVVQAILEPVLLRRTKNMKKDGKPLVELPPKEVVIERITFSPKEQELYNWFLARAESSVQASIKKGDILKRYTMILVHILRLRQICCHMDLIKGGCDEMDEDLSSKQITEPLDIPPELLVRAVTFTVDELAESKKNIHEKFPNLEDLECSICTTQPIAFENISFTECGHSFCLSCILEHCNYQEIQGNPTLCPNCRHDISSSKLLQPKHLPTGSSFTLNRYDNSLRSSKLNALLSHLRIIRDTSPNEKVVVFSQFSTYLDIMERELQLENGLTIFKFHGRLSMEKRSEILKEFKKPRLGTTVLLLSLKAGGVGLNLTEASKAFMCDPWWAPGTEDQAIDRIHRIGQESPVKVTRFIMEGTIEEKMLKIQERKRTIGEAVEVEEEERRKKRVEEIQMLFESTSKR